MIRESIKVTCCLILVIAAITAAVTWMNDRPTAETWTYRIGGSLLAVVSLGVILALQFQRDKVPDYLRKQAGSYFNRDGFCFAFDTSVAGGICCLNTHFQNQFDQPCRGRIMLQPQNAQWKSAAKIEAFAIEIDCEPAAFGLMRLAIPVPKQLQGTEQSFEVGASVQFSSGKRTRLRYNDGIAVKSNTKFDKQFRTAVTVVGALGGSLILISPASVKLDLPDDVASKLEKDYPPKIKTLWKLGDPPLGSAEPDPTKTNRKSAG